MGLIQAALSAAGGVLADQWKEYFYCEAIPSDIIAVKGHKKVRGLGANRGDDNIISDGSVIAVADGQCMVIVEQGQVVDICAQPGEFIYDSKTEPSIWTEHFRPDRQAFHIRRPAGGRPESLLLQHEGNSGNQIRHTVTGSVPCHRPQYRTRH